MIRSPLSPTTSAAHRVGRTFARALLGAVVLAPITAPLHARETANSRFGIGIETGAVQIARNDVRVAGDTGTRFDMNEVIGDEARAFGRLHLNWRFDERHAVRAVFAPLAASGTGTLERDTVFEGATFAAGAATGTYQFNAYKFTYRYSLAPRGNWYWRLGFTAVVRDARIELAQGNRLEETSNVGFVPTLHVSAERRLSERWSFGLDFDGLAGGPGRLFDLAVTVHRDLGDDWRIGAGYRTLEGGADTDEVFNFAWLNHAVLDIRYRY